MYDPHQPRIPEGHHGGGRWTRGGYGYLSDVGKLPLPLQQAEGAPRAPDAWDGQPDDLYLLSDLDRGSRVRGVVALGQSRPANGCNVPGKGIFHGRERFDHPS